MGLSGNFLNIAVTVMVAMLVLLLPVIDRAVCRRCGINPGFSGGEERRQLRLLRLRMAILYGIFAIYGLAVAYLVFFSRIATEEYQIHIALMDDFRTAITFDTTYVGVLDSILENGLMEGLSNIHIENIADISQVYLNIMLFIPFGYLAPYCIARFRTRPILRPTVAGFMLSFVIENLQLVFKRGFYDADDLLSNTIGALLGAVFYRIFAYTVTHPNWRREMQGYRRWRRYLRRFRVYPFAQKSISIRTTLYAAEKGKAEIFYEQRLGFRLIGEAFRENGTRTLLYRMGGTQLEVICVGDDVPIYPQYLTFTVGNIERVHKKLAKHGIDVSDYSRDEYSDLRSFSFTGPDSLTVTILG